MSNLPDRNKQDAIIARSGQAAWCSTCCLNEGLRCGQARCPLYHIPRKTPPTTPKRSCSGRMREAVRQIGRDLA